MIKINIVDDFAESTGGRFKKNGINSGEEFRESILLPKALETIKLNERLFVDLDGGYGHGSSFLEEAFGGMIRKLKKEEAIYIINNIDIKSLDEPRKKEDVFKYMNDELKNK